jgi:hypothetical protein
MRRKLVRAIAPEFNTLSSAQGNTTRKTTNKMESRASLVWALVFVVGQVACHKFAVPGVPEKLVKHYVGDVFKCLDGSADMPASFVNDNY